MPFNYLDSFPIPKHVMPPRLRELLTPVGLSPSHRVEVSCMLESDPYGKNAEYLQLLMAVAPGTDNGPIPVLSAAGEGVVAFSVPCGDKYGCASNFLPSISGYDYVVASWGGDSFYTFSLAEKVWMMLGLTPRCEGNDQQRMIYDDLSGPVFTVAEGEISSSIHWNLKRNVVWRMSNEYLRRYLWMRGARGVRVFFYQALVEDVSALRALMDGQGHVCQKPLDGVPWYKLDIREFKGKILLQVWASVEAVMPELCPEQTADGIVWPGNAQPMTRKLANNILPHRDPVYLDDRFLQKYEQNAFYDATPVRVGGYWRCSPSYKGQWSFTECCRVGRNLIQVPMHELYKGTPDREILHAHEFAVDPTDVTSMVFNEEHIVAKVQRLLDVLLRLGDALVSLAVPLGLNKTAAEWTGFDRETVVAEGFSAYPPLCRLAQIAPLDMTQQAFLARCKTLHEVGLCVSSGYLKSLLGYAGCTREAVKNLGTLKLLQALLNVVAKLNEQNEKSDAFASKCEPEGWQARNKAMAPLFLNNYLRIADAHENIEKCLVIVQELGFDTGSVNAGYGRALDFVMDGVISSLGMVAEQIETLLAG